MLSLPTSGSLATPGKVGTTISHRTADLAVQAFFDIERLNLWLRLYRAFRDTSTTQWIMGWFGSSMIPDPECAPEIQHSPANHPAGLGKRPLSRRVLHAPCRRTQNTRWAMKKQTFFGSASRHHFLRRYFTEGAVTTSLFSWVR